MPASGLCYSIDARINLVTISGDCGDAADWQRLLSQFVADPQRPSECVVLRDRRQGTTPVDAATAMAIMDVVRSFWHQLGVRRAAILMVRKFDTSALVAEALATDHGLLIRAFQSEAEALEWLSGNQPA